jgi:hypothetical protein
MEEFFKVIIASHSFSLSLSFSAISLVEFVIFSSIILISSSSFLISGLFCSSFVVSSSILVSTNP